MERAGRSPKNTVSQRRLLASRKIPKADLHLHAETYAHLDRLIATRDDRPPYDWKDSIKRMAELPPGMARLDQLDGDLDTTDLHPLAVNYVHFAHYVSAMLSTFQEKVWGMY